jgi:hypothetical protein
VIRDLDCIDLDAYAERVRRIVGKVELAREQAIPDVQESKHCKYCDASAHCPVKTARIRQLAAGDAAELAFDVPVTPRMVGLAWERLTPIKDLVKKLETDIKKFASHTDVPLSNGKVLRKVVRRGNEKLDGPTVRAVLLEKYGPEIAGSATRPTTAKKWIEDALRGAAGVTSVDAAKEAVIVEVRKRGGSSYETKDCFEEVDPEPTTLRLVASNP